MINEYYKNLTNAKSVIRMAHEYGVELGKQIGNENVFDFSLGNPSVSAPQRFTDVMMDLLKNKDAVYLHQYSPTLGIHSVREKVAISLNNRFGLNYKADHIFMTAGAASAIVHSARCISKPGDVIITFAPYFVEYEHYIGTFGIELRVVPADTEAFQINFDAFESMFDKNVSAVLINTPNNPSGTIYTKETLERLVNIIKAKSNEFGHEIYLISDEPYREIVFDGEAQTYPASLYDYTLTCYSFSKSLSVPGERIGYIAVNPKCPEAMKIVEMFGQISRGIGHNCPSSIIQLAVAEVLDETSDLKIYETNMNLIYDKLKSLGFSCIKPSGTFYIFPKALEEDAVEFCKKALKYNIILVPSDTFKCKGHFRIAYCTETDKVLRSLDAFEKLVKNEY